MGVVSAIPIPSQGKHMISDIELAAEIEADELKPKRGRPPKAAEVLAKIEGDETRKVWVRCVSENKPWADDAPLDYWKTYEINIKDATLLESRRFVVILETPKKGT